MKRLSLIRHAQADNLLSGHKDWDRALTRRGLLDAAEMAQRLKSQCVESQCMKPDLILSSPAIRARQTAEVFAKCFSKARLQLLEELYLCAPKPMLAAIQQVEGNAMHLLVVGHNPGISELADQLAEDRRIDGMPTASIVTMQFEIKKWQALLPAMGIDVEFDYPQRLA